MANKFLTTIITDLAKSRIRIDSIPQHPLRDSLESEYQAKLERLKDAVPTQFRQEIDGLIEAEIEHQWANKTNKTLPEN